MALLVAWAANTSLLASPPNEEPWLLAHRGMAQTFDLAGVENDTCTAERFAVFHDWTVDCRTNGKGVTGLAEQVPRSWTNASTASRRP